MEPDERHEHDSTFGGDRESIASSSTSLSSAMRQYEYENGRRYHSYQAGKYAFPNVGVCVCVAVVLQLRLILWYVQYRTRKS
jgi:hypothetical protein